MAEFTHVATLAVPFGEARLAQVACASLGADQELSSDRVSRTISAKDAVLEVEFRAESLRMLRVSVNGFMDSLILVAKTIEAFA
ncbi:hypothetical protein IWQ56_001257 [Coemansia nantahalensis]|uniref:Uncharacterized protein n=2 Tax=Coemansia TaxID=4863 RepID=A0ACC1LHD8_9FUNG|nr:hypothetical protein IWQ57_004413 [Coemansia nantahalensis]KAJ2772727.1 hypothetical protein IWQ56_001257 [Coemansia nantahalensis]KAJ2808322.1 hypothetical protein H4R21_000110 [Coemansia helicoidea]